MTPSISPELARAVSRLGSIRRQIKELEAEETLVREEVLSQISDWPRETFPVRIGAHEVRVSDRRGRVDVAKARVVLEEHELMRHLPYDPVVADAESVVALRRLMAHQAMPEETRALLLESYRKAIQDVPEINAEVLGRLTDEALLDEADYRLCFKDKKPSVMVVVIR